MSKKHFTLFIACIGIFFGCDDIFEEDISSKKFDLIAPANNLNTAEVNHTFWWEEVENATGYTLQIVSPSFGYIDQLILDTTITKTQFAYTLESGIYEWRVKAFNNSSYIISDTNSLIINEQDISSEIVELLTPSNNLHTADTIQTFKWSEVFGATGYVLRIVSPSFNAIDELVVDTIINSKQFTITLKDGTYQWRVKAFNDISETFSDTNTLIIDTTLKSSYSDNQYFNKINDNRNCFKYLHFDNLIRFENLAIIYDPEFFKLKPEIYFINNDKYNLYNT